MRGLLLQTARNRRKKGVMDRIQRNDLVFYQFEVWRGLSALRHGVFTRLGGVSQRPFNSLNVGGTVGDDLEAVRANQRRIHAALGTDEGRACTVWQVHSADAVVVDHRAPGRHWLARADAMVTNVPELPLIMRFADCVPILFYDPNHQVAGIAHAGWRGTVGKVAAAAVRAMQSAYGSHPKEIRAAIGPSIGPEHYQVGPEVVEAVRKGFGQTNDLIRWMADGSTHFDLWRANRQALLEAGLQHDHIETAGICTASHTEEFFSHRAERGKTGRFCAVIALER